MNETLLVDVDLLKQNKKWHAICYEYNSENNGQPFAQWIMAKYKCVFLVNKMQLAFNSENDLILFLLKSPNYKESQ